MHRCPPLFSYSLASPTLRSLPAALHFCSDNLAEFQQLGRSNCGQRLGRLAEVLAPLCDVPVHLIADAVGAAYGQHAIDQPGFQRELFKPSGRVCGVHQAVEGSATVTKSSAED